MMTTLKDTSVTPPAVCTKCGVHHGIPSDFASGTPLDFSCRYCGGEDVRVVTRLEPKPVGTYSVAGAATKVVATEWPYGICGSCGHTSRASVA